MIVKYVPFGMMRMPNGEVVSATTQLKIVAPDGKRRLTDMLDFDGIIALGKEFPSTQANRFIGWFTFSDDSIDGKSKKKAYALFESSFINSIMIKSPIDSSEVKSLLKKALTKEINSPEVYLKELIILITMR